MSKGFGIFLSIALALLLLTGTAAQAAVSAGDQKCLACHSMTGLSKSLGIPAKLKQLGQN